MTGPRVTADDLAGLRRQHAEYVAAFNADVPCEQWLTDVGSAAVGVCEAFPALIDRAESAEHDLAAAQTQLAAVRALMQDAVNEHQPHAIAPFVFVDELRAALAEGPAPETQP